MWCRGPAVLLPSPYTNQFSFSSPLYPSQPRLQLPLVWIVRSLHSTHNISELLTSKSSSLIIIRKVIKPFPNRFQSFLLQLQMLLHFGRETRRYVILVSDTNLADNNLYSMWLNISLRFIVHVHFRISMTTIKMSRFLWIATISFIGQ